MLARKYPDLERPIFCAKRISLRERWRDYWFHEHLRKMDERALREQWRIDGRAEGLVEGRAEGLAASKLEIARKLKGRGRPLTEIVEDTGLSLEIIENL